MRLPKNAHRPKQMTVAAKKTETPARAATPEGLKGYVPSEEFKYVSFEQEEESNARAELDVDRLVRWW